MYLEEDDSLNLFLKNYLNSIRKRLSSCMERYDYRNLDVQGFQVLIYRLDYIDIVVAKRNIKLKILGGDKDMFNLTKINNIFNCLLLSLF